MKKIFYFTHEKRKGMALVLAVLILANLFVIAFLVADIVIRIGRASSEIGRSEIAYLAAETAVEKAVYQIEAERNISGLGSINSSVNEDMLYADAAWSRYVSSVNNTLLSCVDSNGRLGYFDNPGDPEALSRSCIYAEDISGFNTGAITSTNPLKVRLRPNWSFQLELDINGLSYPSYLAISWNVSNPAGRVIFVEDDEQALINTAASNNWRVPPAGILNSQQRLRIVNQSASDVIYTITPSSSNPLPLGILIHASGTYGQEQERILEVERRNWRIY